MTPHGRRALVLVAAVGRNGIIGAQGGLPWRLPGDLAHFRALTMGHALLMGRATFESIGRPLPGRLTTVLSRDPLFAPEGVAIASDLAAAIETATHQSDMLGSGAIMVVGGAAVYAATIDRADTLLITDVEAWPDGDAAFPVIDPDRWHASEAREATPVPGDEARYRFVRWDRKGAQLGHSDDKSVQARP